MRGGDEWGVYRGGCAGGVGWGVQWGVFCSFIAR